MVEYGRGAKAGLVAGIIWGIIMGAIFAILLTAFKDTVLSGISTNPAVNITADQLYTDLVVFDVSTTIGLGLIGGVVLGIIFALVYTAYMKSTSIRLRGLVFGIVLGLIGLAYNYDSGSGLGIEYFVTNTAGIFIAALVFGYLLGYFFERFRPGSRVKEEQESLWPDLPPESQEHSKAGPRGNPR